MPSVPEIIVFEASKTYQENPEAVTTAAVGELNKVAGIEKSYNGYIYDDEVEAGIKKAVWVNVWDSYDSAAKQLEHLKSLFKEENKPEIFHAKVVSDASKAITSKCTEIVTLKLKSGETIDTLFNILGQLKALFDGKAPGWHAMTWGQAAEDPNTVIALLGWDSKQAHVDAVVQGTEAYDLIQKMIAIAPLTLFHVDLKAFSG